MKRWHGLAPPIRDANRIDTRLLDDFDLEAVPVTVIDGKNLW